MKYLLNQAGEPNSPNEDSCRARRAKRWVATLAPSPVERVKGRRQGDPVVRPHRTMTGTAFPLDQLSKEIEAVRPRVLRHARRAASDPHKAEDAVQEAICRAISSNTVEPLRVGAWLTTVTQNILIDESRKLSRAAKKLAGAAEEHHPDPCEEIVDADTARTAEKVMDRLNPLQREILLSVATGESVKDISARTGHSIRSVEGHLRRARSLMRSWLS